MLLKHNVHRNHLIWDLSTNTTQQDETPVSDTDLLHGYRLDEGGSVHLGTKASPLLS